jgi:hypothetical protein
MPRSAPHLVGHGTPCPLFDGEDAMDVIGHYDEGVGVDTGKVIGNIDPAGTISPIGLRSMRPDSTLPNKQCLRNAQIVTK